MVAAGLRTQACRTPFHCFREPPCPIAIGMIVLAAAAAAPALEVAKADAVEQMKAVAWGQRAATSCSLVAAEHTFASAGIRLGLVGNSNLAVGMADSILDRHMASLEAEMMERGWPAQGYPTKACQSRVVVADKHTADEERSMLAAAAPD